MRFVTRTLAHATVLRPFRAAPIATLVAGIGLFLQACGGSTPPTQPPPPPPPVINPPQNALPSIATITVQGRRPKQPARFADAREVIDVTAIVTDAETPVADLMYQWSATAGTFAGTGRTVAWTAPDSVAAPTTVTITLKVVEQYGYPGQAKIYSQEVSATQTLSLHDSVKEVGDMSRQFLIDFSTTQIPPAYTASNYWAYIMRNFKAAACPQPGEVAAEREDVERHYNNFTMHNYRVDPASVTVNFGGVCAYAGVRGDACAAVGTLWDSTDRRDNTRRTTTGIDHISASYSSADSRWWLCSSYFQSTSAFGASSYWQ